MTVDRRALLRGAAVAAAGVSLSGCSDVLGSVGGSGPSADGSWQLPDHAALTALSGQPAKGPSPGDAPGLIVAFEDPSCPACRRFERRTYPDLRSELVEPGKATFVFRGVPVVAPWGEPATRALEATFARDAAAFWQLKGHYYAEQDAFTGENVLDRTEQFLSSETSVDAAAVVRDVREGAFDDEVEADLSAARELDLRGTPTFYLFSRGEFRTAATGSQSVSVFERVLGV